MIFGFLRDTKDARVGGDHSALAAERPSFLGYPLIPSAQVRSDLTTVGIYDGSTTTHTYLLWCYTPAWRIYEKAGLVATVIDRPETGQRVLVGRQRLAFEHMYPSAETTTEMVYGFVNTTFPS